MAYFKCSCGRESDRPTCPDCMTRIKAMDRFFTNINKHIMKVRPKRRYRRNEEIIIDRLDRQRA